MMKTTILGAVLSLLTTLSALAQVTVSPDNITAYSQGATSAYLTFSGVTNLTPADAVWCGDIISAAPDIGFKCDPANIFGVLPSRYDQSRLNGSRYTDIMSITPIVARRAYTDATLGNDSRFFYVKHFIFNQWRAGSIYSRNDPAERQRSGRSILADWRKSQVAGR